MPPPRVKQLGYLVFEASDVNAWEDFATHCIGLESHRTNRGLELRLDSHQCRLFVEEGPADDLVAIGWEATSAETFQEIFDSLETRSHSPRLGTAEEAQKRHVKRVMQCSDPSGITLEVYTDAARAETPFQSALMPSGFEAEELGLGHLVISSTNKDVSLEFYQSVFGFRISDYIKCNLMGFDVDLVFLHINGRHHSLAFGGPQAKNLHHFMLEVNSVSDVGLAFDRHLKSGLPIHQTIGMHPNDRMVSYYAETPSGFQIEVGCQGRIIDDDDWEIQTYDHVSVWGHHHPTMLRPKKRASS